MKTYLLFPSDYFDYRKVDEALMAEYEAAKPYFDIILFNDSKWFDDQRLVLLDNFPEKVKAIYRGWMMKTDDYLIFYQALQEKNIELVTNPIEYKLFHEFPNIYPRLEEDTAKTLIFPSGRTPKMSIIRKHFSKFLIKDYVKSVKDSRFPRYFDSSMSDEELEQYLIEFTKFRGNLFTGGYCFKEFLDLKYYGHSTNEYRIFYFNDTILSISKNSGQFGMCPLPPEELVNKYTGLPSTYYTIDVAELEDGSWKILEAGDGQVSGLSDNQDYDEYFEKLILLNDAKRRNYEHYSNLSAS